MVATNAKGSSPGELRSPFQVVLGHAYTVDDLCPSLYSKINDVEIMALT